MKFRKKPLVIEAIQFKGDRASAEEVIRWVDQRRMVAHENPFAYGMKGDEALPWIKTLEGKMVVSPGDFIVCGSKHEFYPVKPDIFAMTYDAVDDTVSPAVEAGPKVRVAIERALRARGMQHTFKDVDEIQVAVLKVMGLLT